MLSLEEADALLASLGADDSTASLLPLHLPYDAPSALGGSDTASSSGESLSSSCEAPPRRDTAPASQKKRKKQSNTRERERAELLALRQRASELSDRLNALRASVLFPRPLEGRQLVWRHLACRRLADRRRAEQENARLRQQIAVQAAMAQSWRDRFGQEARDPEDLAHALDDDDRAALDVLVAGLDPAYALVDVVFSERRGEAAARLGKAHLGSPRDKVWDAQFVQFSGDGANARASSAPAVELRDERVLPFGFQLVVDAVWESWRMWHVGGTSSISSSWSSSHQYAGIDRPEHTFALKFRLACAGPDRSTVFLNEKLAVRRYMDSPDRLVIVWRGTSEGERELFGHGSDETGWVVVERAPPPSDSADVVREQALMRSHVRMVPTGVGTCSPTEWSRLADVVIKSYEEDVGFIYREMETLLLRASRGQE